MRVLSVASEAHPLVKTGGLADVVGSLPPVLAREGVTVRTMIPGYGTVLDAIKAAESVHDFGPMYGGPVRLLAARAAGADFLVIDAPHLYARFGNPYVGPDGRDWPDNALRFAALAQCAAAVGRGALPGFVPDVVHAHDWQAGLAPAYLHYAGGPRPRTVMTIHNLAFQGQFPKDLLPVIGLPAHAYAIDGVEYYGTIGYLKAGLALADRITTVSPTYAAEIQTPESGMGMDGLLRRRAGVLSAIINGIDDELWNPATDERLAAPFDLEHLVRRVPNKETLQKRMGLAPERGTFVFGVVSRLTQQKGMDLLLEALPAVLASGAQLAVLGTGDKALEVSFATAGRTAPGRIGTIVGYDEALAHLVQAGADALLIPSRFEPCGLTQLCALRYGAIPVVTRVGGLADTVVDADAAALAAGTATGVQFAPVTRAMLEQAIGRTLSLSRDRTAWRRLQSRAMATDVGWSQPAKRYATLFRELVTGAAA